MDRNSFFFESFVLLQPYTMHFCTISLRNNLLATKQNYVTIIPSVLFSLVGFCSPQEVKFSVFAAQYMGTKNGHRNTFCRRHQYTVYILSSK